MNDDDAKRRIYARRAKFVAAAVAGLAAVATDACSSPKACLFPTTDSGRPHDEDANPVDPVFPDASLRDVTFDEAASTDATDAGGDP